MENKLDIEDLTLKQIREIGKLVACGGEPKSAVAGAPIASILVGKKVVVRSHLSGVWHGTLESCAGSGIVLTTARRAWYWEGAGSCSGLAITGPSGGKITPPVVRVILNEYVEMVESSLSASEQWAKVPAWSGR